MCDLLSTLRQISAGLILPPGKSHNFFAQGQLSSEIRELAYLNASLSGHSNTNAYSADFRFHRLPATPAK
jgi:hypothetical protein